MLALLSLFFGTFLSEDLACITAGLLIQRGEIGVVPGLTACALGIFVGDLGLWGAGRAFGSAPFVSRLVGGPGQQDRSADVRAWLERHAAAALLVSRFLPGTRLPLYVTAGLLKLPATVFAGWCLLGVVLWTPALVLLTAGVGDTFIARASPVFGFGAPARLGAASAVFGLLYGSRLVLSRCDWIARGPRGAATRRCEPPTAAS